MADLQKFCDELRAKISIVDVVGAKVKLVRKGREFTGLCPFHNEKTPSFTVNEAKGFYHCFGCGAHGDIIKFEMEANNLSFMETIEKLAHKVGMEVPRISNEQHEEIEKKNSLYDIMDLAAKFFEKNLRLTGGEKARDYLVRRGFGEDIIAKFRLGYAPSNNGLRTFLASKGVDEHEMSELGLVSLAENNTSKRTFDFFRDRVIIPIMDKKGRVIAFGGRIMGEGQPKYLNSPETPIFNKRRVLYNLNNARDKGFDAKTLIICEGYMDVIAMDKYGIGYAVAPLGTALTEDQIMEAWRVVPEPILCFDGDSAGIRAAVRSVDRALPILKAGYSLKFAFLPDKLDPDDFLKAKGREEFLKVVNDTMPLKDLLWKKNIDDQDISTPEQKALIEKNVKEEVAKIADETVRGYYVQEMQNKIYYELGKGAWKPKPYNNANGNYKNGKKNDFASPQVVMVRPKTNLNELCARYIVSALANYPELIEEYEEKLLNFDIKNQQLKAVFDAMLNLVHEETEINGPEGLYEALKNKGLQKDIDNMLEFKVIKIQNPNIFKMRENLEVRIVEEQLKQLDVEIRECLRIIEVSESFPDDVYNQYQLLKKERESLLVSQDVD